MPSSSLRVLRPGAFATVQDLGRPGARSSGVPEGGAFDLSAFRLANALVGNPPEAAALELTLLGGLFEAHCPLTMALTGAPMPAEVESENGTVSRRTGPPRSFSLKPGDRLRIGGARSGARAYLAVRGGFLTGPVLGSRSSESPVEAGACLPVLPSHGPSRRPRPGTSGPPEKSGPEAPLRVLPGPDAPVLPEGWTQEALFQVGPLSDRVGVRLEDPGLPVPGQGSPQRRSAPVAPGAVQWTPGGLIVLGPTGGTMGGYPHVAHVISADLDRLAQLRPGDPVRFALVGLAEARRLARERLRFLRDRDLRIALLPWADEAPASS